MNVTLADSNNIPKLANLFNKYRIFYGEETNLQAATIFLQSRFKYKDSVILIAHENSQISGFIQLYPSFSSVGMQTIGYSTIYFWLQILEDRMLPGIL